MDWSTGFIVFVLFLSAVQTIVEVFQLRPSEFRIRSIQFDLIALLVAMAVLYFDLADVAEQQQQIIAQLQQLLQK